MHDRQLSSCEGVYNAEQLMSGASNLQAHIGQSRTVKPVKAAQVNVSQSSMIRSSRLMIIYKVVMRMFTTADIHMD